jgi:hypothetical protein
LYTFLYTIHVILINYMDNITTLQSFIDSLRDAIRDKCATPFVKHNLVTKTFVCNNSKPGVLSSDSLHIVRVLLDPVEIANVTINGRTVPVDGNIEHALDQIKSYLSR